GFDERALVAEPSAAVAAPSDLIERFPGPAETNGALLDRLEEATSAVLREVVGGTLARPQPHPKPPRNPLPEGEGVSEGLRPPRTAAPHPRVTSLSQREKDSGEEGEVVSPSLK